MKVSVLGPAGSYSEIAARAFFETAFDGKMPEILFCSSIENTVMRLFEADGNGDFSYCAVIPIENSIEGAVGVSMDLLLEKEVSIVAELVLPVNHCLLVSEKTAQMPGFSPEKIEAVYSHPQGLYQCRTYIQKHLKNASFIETDSTSKAALCVYESAKLDNAGNSSDQTFSCFTSAACASSGAPAVCAAIASAEAGRAYNLKTIDGNIQDNLSNSTRFLFLVRSDAIPLIKAHVSEHGLNILPECLSQTGSGEVFYKTSVVASPLHDKPGALLSILEAFSGYNLNLTRIESRPSKKSLGEYNFYIDFEGRPSDKNVSEALALVEKRSSRLKILGTYGRILANRQ